MPPTNSPNDTRPSTPPPYPFATSGSSLSSHPYLQQLEQAISTPVPDLASTLTTPESSRPRSDRRRRNHDRTASGLYDDDTSGSSNNNNNSNNNNHSQESDPRTSLPLSLLQLSRAAPTTTDDLLLESHLHEDEAYLARSSEQITRIQSEVERWQHERNRLRDILHTQQDRQSMLEEQNYRLREHRSRLQEEHQRLHDQSSRLTEQNARLRGDFERLREREGEEQEQEQEREVEHNLGNLAGAIAAEVGRDRDNSYATSGQGPERERLYDWAATRRLQEDTTLDEEEEEVEPAAARQGRGQGEREGEIDSGPRRELERALRNYRMARNAFRSGRQSGTADLGAVPTASALRAYWHEEAPPEQQAQPAVESESSASRAPFALSEFVEQHRLERQRRHLETVRRHNEHRARIEGQYDHHRLSRDMARYSVSSEGSEAFMRVRNTLRYLSELRETNVRGGLELARNLGLDSLYECPDANTPSDLPMTAESLPEPQPSSWLKPGMTWHGLQSTDREPSRPPLLASTLRRIRQRDHGGRAMVRRGFSNDPYSQHSYRSLQPIPPEETDRYLTSLMQDSSGRWGLNDPPDHAELPGLGSGLESSPLVAPDRSPTAASDADHWPVTVTLHEVDWEDMTISGTMRASQIPDKTAETDGKSMESYFQGEIIDFWNHTLQSDGSRFGYKVGGVDIDARYWARLGPFKREIDRATALVVGVGTVGKKWDGKTKYYGHWTGKETADAVTMSSEDRQRKEMEAEEVMARCLGSTKWLREKVGGEWVLMRWKEKCFVDPIMPLDGGTSKPFTTSQRPTSSEYPTTSTTLLGDRAQALWGLTISGFYYIALHRQTGRIDGLYYDPGSQPYQSLRMAPEGCRLVDEDQETTFSNRYTGSTVLAEMEGTGLKKWFPAVEFR